MNALSRPSRKSRAGGSADRHFKEARTAWRRRVLPRVQLPLFVLVAAVVATNVAFGGEMVSWTLGLAAGALIAIYAAVRDDPPHYIERWRRGAEGERRTAKRLRALERTGWRVLHDLGAERSNRDHVVIGAGGVFLLDTKWLDGEVAVDERGVLHVTRPDDPLAAYGSPRLASWMRRSAAEVKREVERHSGQRGVWVQAVVVLWGRFEQQVVDADRVTFVHGDALVDWLRSRDAVLQPPRVAALAAALEEAAAPFESSKDWTGQGPRDRSRSG